MTEKLQNKLYKKFNKIFAQKDQSLRWGFECDDGWYELIYSLCEKIQAYIDKVGCQQVIAIQIKEKFGSLRFYIYFDIDLLNKEDAVYDAHYNVIQAMIDKASEQSLKICEATGGHGVLHKRGTWLKTLSKESSVLLGYKPCEKAELALFVKPEE
jgi:hypothetical protein